MGDTAGGIASGGSTRRENGVTKTDHALFFPISADSLEEIQRHWNALAVDATVVEPLIASAWSASFGTLKDSFGVTWTFSVTDS